MKLVIVESPTKAKTLSKFLDKSYDIKASKGHIRDLPKSGLGVDVDNNFQPEYVVPSKAKKVITSLKKDAKKAEGVVLATDPDREGEAIAWHLQNVLTGKGSNLKNKDFERVVFHELTGEAVEEAFSHPAKVNDDLVNSQQARRVLDRLVGYKLSPLLWKKVRYGLSAGRVQSVAVRLIVERERERQAFVPKEYWSIEGDFKEEAKKVRKADQVRAELFEKNGKKIEVKNENEAVSIKKDLDGDNFKVAEIKKSERKRKPYAPFKTSTLQQAAANLFGFSAKRTMSAAQTLFEQGKITYHRTDSLNLSPKFVDSTRSLIKKDFGAAYLPKKGIFYKTSSKSAQEAHEAIRPVDINASPQSTKGLKGDALKIYTLVWKRSVECQMLSAIYDQTLMLIGSEKGYAFKATGSVIKFDGWLAVSKHLGIKAEIDGNLQIPDIKEYAALELVNLDMEQHFTQSPARYSDATLIKKLEELGVGRPSTYAPTISTIQSRGYVLKEGRYFAPEDVAYVVIDLLVEHFPNIVDYEFTAGMEEDLDKIAEGNVDWVAIVREFYTPFEKVLSVKENELQKSDVTTLEESDEECPECGKKLVVKLGKYGKFLSCSGYPDCKFAKPLNEDLPSDENGDKVNDFGRCDKCEDGVMVLKQGRFGKFLACNNYPKCKNTRPYLDKIGMKCPSCGEGEVVVKKAKRRTFYGCSRYPDCNYSSWKNPLTTE